MQHLLPESRMQIQGLPFLDELALLHKPSSSSCRNASSNTCRKAQLLRPHVPVLNAHADPRLAVPR
jgi:hypothetical protein